MFSFIAVGLEALQPSVSTDFLGLLQVLLPLTAPSLTARRGSYSSNWPLEYAAGRPDWEGRTFPRSLLGLVNMGSSFHL